jgi:hypothetical protein
MMPMRELFISERRYIENVISKCMGLRRQVSGRVAREYYAPPRSTSKVRFNNDYFLELASGRSSGVTSRSYGAVILPNTIGVDVFVTVDQQTFQPLMTELLGGEAFSLRYFKEHVDKVEDRLAELSRPVKLRRTSYCRVFVIENDICFLAFPNDVAPIVRGTRQVLYDGAESSIECSLEGGELVYVDGWIRTDVAESDRKLEAISGSPITAAKSRPGFSDSSK